MPRSRLGRCIGEHLVYLTLHLTDTKNESAMEKRFDQPGPGEAGTFPGPTSGYCDAGSRSNDRCDDPDYRDGRSKIFFRSDNIETCQGPKPMELDSMQQCHNKHTSHSWTACYDDACCIHLSDKEGSGWFPRMPKSAAKRQRELQKQRELEAEVAADQAGKVQIPW